MEQLTELHFKKTDGFYMKCSEHCCKEDFSCEDCKEFEKLVDRLGIIENILGDEYNLDRLRELVQAERLLGKTLYEPNKRGFISTYQVISIHIFEHSVLLGWELLDGMYSNVNGFEISALGEKVFLTREDAEDALRREQE